MADTEPEERSISVRFDRSPGPRLPSNRSARDRGARVTIEDVAEVAGVSTATVSRVINAHPDVSQATRAEVMKHARELGYVSNRGASAEPTAKGVKLIALAVPELHGDNVTEVITGAAEALKDHDARLVLSSVGGKLGTTLSLPERLLKGTTEGALLVMPAEDTQELVELGETGYPFVVIEPAMPIDIGIPTVTVTNWGGAKMAAEYLIGLGHTHIGIITGPSGWRVSADRLAGYQAALLTAGLPILPRLVQEADFTIDGGRYAAERLLSLAHAPTAIFATDDAMAVGVLQAARARGLHPPRDLSVMGFGDARMAAITTPGLTSVQLPLQGLGRVGADMLWRLLQGQELDAPRIELSTSLVIRESTSAPRGTSFSTI
jgi:LacI family transcriptional regulator